LLATPHEFLRDVAREEFHADLPEVGRYACGFVFFSKVFLRITFGIHVVSAQNTSCLTRLASSVLRVRNQVYANAERAAPGGMPRSFFQARQGIKTHYSGYVEISVWSVKIYELTI
jgi:hypothetical protein